jgi:endonuclease/exonuclease/phosphatase family metal-dependent hydrolase
MFRPVNRLESLEDRTLFSSASPRCIEPPHELRVMTQNLYLGADLTPVIAAPSLADVPAAVSAVWANVQATDFRERAVALARQIAKTRPDVLALQEAALWRIQEQGDQFTPNPTPATDVAYDFIKILRRALRARGLDYAPAVINENFDAELPDATGQDIRLTDRDAILVRQDGPRRVKVLSTDAAHYTVNLQVPIAGEGPTFTALCGWTSIDARVNGRLVRVVNTHLDTNVPLIQYAQAAELLGGPVATNLPVILAGDFNSDAYGGAFGGIDATPTYQLMIDAGFQEAWARTHPNDVVFTWGQAPDLSNPVSLANERIDFLFARGGPVALGATIVGDEPADRTPDGLWPSDHAGVVASFGLPRTFPLARFFAHETVLPDPDAMASVLGHVFA